MLALIKAQINKFWGFMLLFLMVTIVFSKVIFVLLIMIGLLYLACVFFEVLTF
jgi:hypothetical protein